jgi:hypothetical protein
VKNFRIGPRAEQLFNNPNAGSAYVDLDPVTHDAKTAWDALFPGHGEQLAELYPKGYLDYNRALQGFTWNPDRETDEDPVARALRILQQQAARKGNSPFPSRFGVRGFRV